MESISRICATSKGTTIDAIGQGRYRVCNRHAVCSDVEGLWQAYETVSYTHLTLPTIYSV